MKQSVGSPVRENAQNTGLDGGQHHRQFAPVRPAAHGGKSLEQLYNVADTWVVGRFLGADALAAVGSAYTLMVFLTSILLGLCMGAAQILRYSTENGTFDRLRVGIFLSFVLIAVMTAVLCAIVYLGLRRDLWILQISRCDRAADSGLSCDCVFGHPGNLPLQLFCKSAACNWRLGHAAAVSGGVRGLEHRARPVFCHHVGLGRGRCSWCDRACAVCVRVGTGSVHSGVPELLPREHESGMGACCARLQACPV